MILTLNVRCVFGAGLTKPCLRVIEMDSEATLSDLHDAIQDAVHFDRDHLYGFFLAHSHRGDRNWLSKHEEWEDVDSEYMETRLGDVFPTGRNRLHYLYIRNAAGKGVLAVIKQMSDFDFGPNCNLLWKEKHQRFLHAHRLKGAGEYSWSFPITEEGKLMARFKNGGHCLPRRRRTAGVNVRNLRKIPELQIAIRVICQRLRQRPYQRGVTITAWDAVVDQLLDGSRHGAFSWHNAVETEIRGYIAELSEEIRRRIWESTEVAVIVPSASMDTITDSVSAHFSVHSASDLSSSSEPGTKTGRTSGCTTTRDPT